MPYFRIKCSYEAHFGLKRLQITSSFQKWYKKNSRLSPLGVKGILVGHGICGSQVPSGRQRVNKWAHFQQKTHETRRNPIFSCQLSMKL